MGRWYEERRAGVYWDSHANRIGGGVTSMVVCGGHDGVDGVVVRR